jgi:hypothetical protein
VLECDYSDSITGADHNIEYDYWLDERCFDTEVEERIEIIVDNETVTGTYQYSQNQMPNNYSSHIYKDSKGTRFAVDSDGMLLFYFWGSSQSENNSSSIYTEQQCVSIAQRFLDDYVNIDDYVISVEHNSARGIYEITFTKWLNGYRTTDCAVVAVKDNGSLYSYSSFMLGRLPNVATIDFHPDIAEQVINQKLDTIYSPVKKDNSNLIYEILNYKYTILENGNLSVYCIVDIEIETIVDDLGAVVQSERVAFVIEI